MLFHSAARLLQCSIILYTVSVVVSVRSAAFAHLCKLFLVCAQLQYFAIIVSFFCASDAKLLLLPSNSYTVHFFFVYLAQLFSICTVAVDSTALFLCTELLGSPSDILLCGP